MMREAIAAAQARIAAKRVASAPSAAAEGFGKALSAEKAGSTQAAETSSPNAIESIKAIDTQVQQAEALGADLITGKVQDMHEVAAQLKRADLTFRFSLQVRDRLIDAYREVMRMSV